MACGLGGRVILNITVVQIKWVVFTNLFCWRWISLSVSNHSGTMYGGGIEAAKKIAGSCREFR